jgi:uncharacterized BrkB/YihY/UPF0761 family membrane protein
MDFSNFLSFQSSRIYQYKNECPPNIKNSYLVSVLIPLICLMPIIIAFGAWLIIKGNFI